MSAPAPSAVAHATLRGRPLIDGWLLVTLGLCVLIALPLVTIFVQTLGPGDGTWSHLRATVFHIYAYNTLTLLAGVTVGTVVLGTSTAWLVTMYRFPLRRVLSFALMLPLAVPGYILAFVVTDQLEYAGNVQSALRQIFGYQSASEYWFPQIRSLGGAAVVLSLVLYPYVYLLARAAFLEQCFALFEVSRTLGRGPMVSFVRVALPMARPAIVVGVALALMETLNELGTVEFFGVPTFTVGIFDVWLNMDSISGAAKLAGVLVTFALALVSIERIARRRRRYHATAQARTLTQYALPSWLGFAASAWCALPVVLGFVLPASVLAAYSIEFYSETLDRDFAIYAWNSIRLATLTAVVTCVVALLLAYGVRLSRLPWIRPTAELATIGYAVPGAVLAVGIMIPLGAFDRMLDGISRDLFDLPTGLLVSGTAFALVVGYTSRFMALAYRSVDSSLIRVTPNMDGASRTLGAGPLRTLLAVHIPLVRPSVLTAALLVFVDTMKELPLTLILRPFNFETLATFVYQYASEELLEECALAALTIVLVGVAPLMFLNRTITTIRGRRG